MHPFTSQRRESVSAAGETSLITEIRRWLGPASPPSPAGIGDDCAVLPPSTKRQVITVDPVIYGQHFDDAVAPFRVGVKLLNRNLSDLAAMGAKPVAAVVALTLDPRVKLAWLEQFYRGLAATARRYAVPIVGGDVAQADGVLAASLTLLGQAAGTRLLTRKGARAGDWIYVTGTLGGSLLGRHHRFTPRLAEGAWLAARDEVRSLMDLSDGLAKDLAALTPHGTEPALAAAQIPISAAARALARSSARDPLDHALSDGEDYELVFGLDRRADRSAFERAWRKRFRLRLSCIGRFVRAGARSHDHIDLQRYQGYEHLR